MAKKSTKPEHILPICLETLEQKGETINSVISRFTGKTDSLRADLEAVSWLKSEGNALDPRPGFVAETKQQLIVRTLKYSNQTSSGFLKRNIWFVASTARKKQFAVQILLVLLLLGSIFYISKNLLHASVTWLPGDITYPLKNFMEETALYLTPSEEGKAQLHIKYTQKRLLEVQALFFENRYNEVPPTVANFAVHVAGAVEAVKDIAKRDPAKAKDLATELQKTLSVQTRLTLLMAGFTPYPISFEFLRVGQISENGLEAMQNVLEPDSGYIEF